MAEIKRTLPGLAPNASYMVRVRAYNQFGIPSEFSEAYVVNTPGDSTFPNPPSGVVSDFSTVDFITTWTPPTQNDDDSSLNDLDHYRIEITDGVTIESFTTTVPFYLYSLTQNRAAHSPYAQHTLTARVYSVDVFGNESVTFGTNTAMNPVPLQPPPPSLGVQYGLVTVSMAPNDADRDKVSLYNVQRADAQAGPWVTVNVSTNPTWVDQRPEAIDTYWYRTVITDIFGRLSSPSNDVSVATSSPPGGGDTIPPDKAVNLQATPELYSIAGVVRGQVTLAWDSPTLAGTPDLAGAYVRWKKSTDSNHQFTTVDASQRGFVVDDLDPGATYVFNVDPYDVSGNRAGYLAADVSAPVGALPAIGTPVLSSPGTTPGGIVYSWTSAVNASDYRIEVNTSDSWTSPLRTYYRDDLTLTFIGTVGTSYYARVTGRDSYGNFGTPSNVVGPIIAPKADGTLFISTIDANQLNAQSSFVNDLNVASKLKMATAGIIESVNYDGPLTISTDPAVPTEPATAGYRLGHNYLHMAAGTISLGGTTQGVFLNSNGRIWSGNSSFTIANWRVEKDGSMRAGYNTATSSHNLIIDSSGNITANNINAVGGTFSGSLSGATGSFNGNLSVGTTPNWFRVDNAGNIWSGADIFANASSKFRVSNAGELTASGVTISGALTATTGTLQTVSITGTVSLAAGGTLLAGNASGTRIELTNTGIKAFKNGVVDPRLEFTTATGELIIRNAQVTGQFDTSGGGSNSGFWLTGNEIKTYSSTGYRGRIQAKTTGELRIENSAGVEGLSYLELTSTTSLFYGAGGLDVGSLNSTIKFRTGGQVDVSSTTRFQVDTSYVILNASDNVWITAPNTAIRSTADATLVNDSGALVVGTSGAQQLGLDRNTIQARSGGVATTLLLNPHGGDITVANVSGNPSLYIRSTQEASLSNNSGALIIGTSGAEQLGFDRNEIQARDGLGGSAILYLNPHGGIVQAEEFRIGGSFGDTIKMFRFRTYNFDPPALAANTSTVWAFAYSGMLASWEAVYVRGLGTNAIVPVHINCTTDTINFTVRNTSAAAVDLNARDFVFAIWEK